MIKRLEVPIPYLLGLHKGIEAKSKLIPGLMDKFKTAKAALERCSRGLVSFGDNERICKTGARGLERYFKRQYQSNQPVSTLKNYGKNTITYYAVLWKNARAMF